MAIDERDPGFDTLAYGRTLKADDVEEKQAEAHAEAALAAREPAPAKAGGPSHEGRSGRGPQSC